VIADSRNIIKGAPFDRGPDSALFADLKAKVNKLAIAQPEKTRLIEAGRKPWSTRSSPLTAASSR
jgi:hypothetical protein